MQDIQHLLDRNKKWSEMVFKENPDFFKNLAKGQQPESLWIGCSDSRVSANKVVNVQPGELFVHRNIANLVIEEDLNCQSVLEYAVKALKVKHIIVCGHYGCGGVQAALNAVIDKETDPSLKNVNQWLEPIFETYKANKHELENLTEKEQFNRLCELNVADQVENIWNSAIIKNTMESNQIISVHGLIYDLETGKLKDLNVSKSNTI